MLFDKFAEVDHIIGCSILFHVVLEIFKSVQNWRGYNIFKNLSSKHKKIAKKGQKSVIYLKYWNLTFEYHLLGYHEISQYRQFAIYRPKPSSNTTVSLLVLQHPDYGQGPGFSPNDIAVIEAASEISGTNIAPATVARRDTNPGGDGWITGWGRTCGQYSFRVV